MAASKSHPYIISLILLVICIVALAMAYFLPKLSSPPPAAVPTQAPIPNEPALLSYPVPDSWTTVKLSPLGISVCLPPDWSYQKPNQITTKSQDKMISVISITSVPSTGSGLLKDIYLNHKLADATTSAFLPPQASVDQFKLNDLPAMFVILPGHPDALVVPTGTNFYEFIANTSAPDIATQDFQTKFYTLAGCLKPL